MQRNVFFCHICQSSVVIISIKFPSTEIFYLFMAEVMWTKKKTLGKSRGAYMGLIFQAVAQWWLRAAISSGNGSAISLTQEFPPPSSHIRNLAPYGRQILLLACEWPVYYTQILMCYWRTDVLSFLHSSKLACFDVSLSFSSHLALQRQVKATDVFELANMVPNTSHARHWVESKHCLSWEDSLY